MIIFDTGPAGGPLKMVMAGGGTAEPVTMLNEARRERAHLYPHFLPDGDHFLYLARTPDAANNAIFIGSVSSGGTTLVANADSRATYDPAGYVLFMRDQSLMALPFDSKKLRATGDPFPIAEPVRDNSGTGATAITVSDNGVLAYRGGDYLASRQLTWFDRAGTRLGTVGPPGAYINPELKRWKIRPLYR